jgi:NitT/TauT family transport system ATP-binding protein/NitT/TauT family transport system permease protein
MQKVVMIMRGILRHDGQIFIMDEPLAGLDAHTREKVIRMILSVCRNKTCVVISHDKEILPYMNRVIDLQTLHKRA